jgi:hypothetical protein
MWHYTSVATTHFFFEKWSNEERAAAIRHFAQEAGESPEVYDHIDYLLTYFSICAENRNILMHSRQAFTGEKPGAGYLSIEKRLRDRTGRKNVFHLDINEIRQVSNDIIRGVTYCIGVDDYLANRNPLNRLMRDGVPIPPLPVKPSPPHKLDPHRPVVNLQADSTLPESSRAE